MNANEADIELIERYINGKLTHAELVDFEIRLEEDREFARKLRLRKAFPSLFNAEGEDEIAQQIPEIPDVKKIKRKGHFLKTRRIVMGTIIALVAGIIIYLLVITIFRSDKKITNQGSVPKPIEKVVNQKPVALNTIHKVPETAQTDIPPAHEQAGKVPQPIELETPADSMVFNRSGEILFSWKQETDSFTRFCVVSDISDKIIWWRGISPGIRELKIPAINFKPGKFYWYVGTKEMKRTIIIK